MNDELLETCQRRFGEMALRMDDGEMICTSASLPLVEKQAAVPAIIIQGGPNARLMRPVVRCQVLGIETSQCPVLGLGILFPLQRDALAGWRRAWMPMHTRDQRALLKLMAGAPAWLLALFRGEKVDRVLVAQIPAAAREEIRRLIHEVEAHPLNPGADTRRAVEVAQVAAAIANVEGYRLEILQELSKGGGARGVRERAMDGGSLGPDQIPSQLVGLSAPAYDHAAR